jgi:hypothetical protein
MGRPPLSAHRLTVPAFTPETYSSAIVICERVPVWDGVNGSAMAAFSLGMPPMSKLPKAPVS